MPRSRKDRLGKIPKCVAYKSCRRKAKYSSPADLCSKHWKMWWKYGIKGKEELPYMKRDHRHA